MSVKLISLTRVGQWVTSVVPEKQMVYSVGTLTKIIKPHQNGDVGSRDAVFDE